jgi:cytochrome c
VRRARARRLGAALAAVVVGGGAIPSAAAEGDAAKGAVVFRKCYSCHSVDPAERNIPGPNLAGIVGRRVAAQRGYDYSPALRALGAAGAVWDEARLDAFIADPVRAIPGSAMGERGIDNAAERADLIAYLKRPVGPLK